MTEQIIKPTFELPQGMIDQMENVAVDIAKAERYLEVLKEMKVDVSELEERLEWAKNMRDVMLKNVGK